MMNGYSTAMRMQRHRAKATADIGVPECLLMKLRDGINAIREASAAVVPLNPKAVNIVCREMDNMMIATTPEHRVRCVSQITGVLRETTFMIQRHVTECKEFLRKLATHFVFPLMLHCAVRYLHRALATLIRTVYVIDEELEACFSEAFTFSHIRCWQSEPSSRPTIFGCRVKVSLDDAEDLLRLKDEVMSWVNCIDSTAVVAMPLFPRAFSSTFLDILPLLGESLQWMVANASAGSHEVEAGNGTAGTLLGEDLAYVRYGIRVVTTYTHKFLHLLENAWVDEGNNNNTLTTLQVEEDVGKLFSPALAMLSSSVFPKDVLNGAGLLVSSLLTLRTCTPWLLLEVCRLCGNFDSPVKTTVKGNGRMHVTLTAGLETQTDVKELVQLVCSDDPQGEAAARPHIKVALQNILQSLTNNGRFALLRGLLAHLSTPLHGNVDSLGILLKPIVPKEEDEEAKGLLLPSSSSSKEAVVVMHDIIMPAAEAYCSALQAPDTRFMAIQTIDSIVRHILSVLNHIPYILDPTLGGGDNNNNNNCDNNGEKVNRVTRRREQKEGGIMSLSEHQKQELLMVCTENPKLTRTLNRATEVIMGMWDDNTLQVAGPLYDAYSEILNVHAALKRCAALFSSHLAIDIVDQDGFDNVDAFRRILCIPNERRGKYHALLAILQVLPIPQFLCEVTKYFSQNEDALSTVGGLCSFSRMLLLGACNHKVGNIAGDVFAKMAKRIRQFDEMDTTREKFFMRGVIEPLVESLLTPGYAAPLHFNEAVCVSQIVTHMVTPCLKSDETFLSDLLPQLTKVRDDKINSSRVNQSIVEIVHRARVAGKDVSAYMRPNSQTFQAVLKSLQVQEAELRFTALTLCVLSTKKAEMVELWQCHMIEWYISTNMHCGGDSAAMRSLLEVYKKWMRRLVDSYGNQKNKQKKEAEGSETAEHYKQLVVDHCVRLVSSLVPHIGENGNWCRNLSLERRVVAMLLYTCLLRNVLEFLSMDQLQMQGLQEKLFPPVLIEGLLESLLEGWEKARVSAYNLLILYCNHAPDAIFSLRYLGNPMTACTAKAELLRAKTFRRAEGEVLRYVLATCFTPEARRAAVENPLQECERRVKDVMCETKLLKEKLSELQLMGTKQACQFVKQYPLHGLLSLSAALLSNAWEVKREVPIFYEACNTLLFCCRVVMQTCSSFVGDESNDAVDDTNNNSNNDEVEVDCRGHVFNKDGSFTEENMRTVVNNTWLSIRAGATAVERVMNLVKVEDLSFPVVHEICYVLIESLLRTKHNGVMRKVREALKTVAAALLRSRDVTFHSLPNELLDFLLGADGVRSSNVARMLRRSQGLPHAILAILEAEDPSIPVFLFPKAMKVLLQVATGAHACCEDDTQDCSFEERRRSQRSNALNVLKFIFENKIFASRSVAGLEEAFWIAAAGFDDTSWGIRNSSLMLFSAVLPRFVGEHPSTGGVGVNTSLHDITVRTPRGVAFAYAELVKSCTSPVPSLGVFPLLQMLSMLTPDSPHLLTNATTAAELFQTAVDTDDDSSRIIRAVIRCGSCKNLMIRAASAVALTSLVPPAHLETLIPGIFFKLSSSENDMNTVHGALLHLQQFHTFYVGTLRRDMRIRGINSNATCTVASLVNRLIIEGFSSMTVPSQSTMKLYRECIHCPTIAATFLSLASDVIYYNQSISSVVMNLIHLGVSVVYNIMCETTSLFESARHDHAAVNEYASLFLLLVIRFLSLTSGVHGAAHVWNVLSRTFASKNGECLISHLMGLVSYYTTEQQQWSYEESERIMREVTQRLSWNPTCAALKMLLHEVAQDSSLQRLPCTRIVTMMTHLKYLVVLSSDSELQSESCRELCVAVEDHLLRRMHPESKHPLQNTEVQSWAIRFLSRCCVRRGVFSETFLSVIEYYSRPFFNVQHRIAVVSALKDGILSFCNGGGGGSNADKEATMRHRCVFLLILLRLLLDDAYDVRLDSCRVVSQLTTTEHLSLDLMTCVISLLFHIRKYAGRGVLSLELVHMYLLGGEYSSVNNILTKCLHSNGNDNEDADADGEESESESEESDVLFEKEAQNVFAENSFLAYLVATILRDEAVRSPTFGVYDELLRVSERRGGAADMYATLFNGKQ